MAVSKKTLVLPAMAFVVLALGITPVIAITGCGSPSALECSDATSSLTACEACVGVRVEGDTKIIPCNEFTFSLNETCSCE